MMSGNDVVIWTKHFTKFATYNQINVRPSSHQQVTTTTTTIPTQKTKQETLINLITLLKKLILEYKQIKGSIPKEWEQFIEPTVIKVTTKISNISRDLSLGIQGDDVKTLQEFLIIQNVGEKALKLKTNGTSNYFGVLTKDALSEYQTKYKILPANGYFGKITRDFLKSIGN
jgi:hypothetical protein